MGGFSNPEAIALGCGMNARGSTEVIVASIGLSVGVLDERLFSVIFAMAVVTTMAMPPTLRWALARLPIREDEEDRLRLESFEEKSFLSNFERILLAVDHSASSDLAARIAGHFAAVRKMPITVLDVVDEPGDGRDDLAGRMPDSRAKEVSERVQSTADATLQMDDVKQASADGEVHVTIRPKDGELDDILSETADKGHDMMFVGVEPSTAEGGGYGGRHTAMVDAFSGTTAIVSARGHLPEADSQLRILVPVSGTERSLNAAEFAFVIAKATGGSIAAVYFKDPAQAASLSRVSDTSGVQQSAFAQLDQIAEFYGLPLEKVTSQQGSPELAILKHARRGRFNLIILGVNRRAGADLSYGTVADTLLETADRSVVFIEI